MPVVLEGITLVIYEMIKIHMSHQSTTYFRSKEHKRRAASNQTTMELLSMLLEVPK
jgi:hypothetical protein